MALKDGKELAELHHLVDVEDVLFERPGERRVEPGQGRKTHLGDLRGRAQRELALEFEEVGGFLRAFPELIGDLDADRQLALESVARANADRDRPCFAPAPQRMLVVHGARVLGRHRLARRDQAVLDGRIDALHERQRHEACEIDRARRPRERKAGFGHVHVQFFLEALAHAVDGGFDVWLEIARKGRQELLFERSRLRPILKPDEAGVRIDQLLAWSIEERDGFRRKRIDREGGGRGHVLNAKLLRADLGMRCRDKYRQRNEQGGELAAAHHGVFQ